VPPESYRIEGSGQGGPAGFARGGAAVSLAEDGTGTVLGYRVKAEVGGKIAQLGARLTAEAPTPEPPAAFNALGAIQAGLFGYPLIAWVAAAVFLFIAFNLLAGFL
jgi:hypothetical protein